MKLGLLDSFGLGSAIRDEEEMQQESDSRGIVSKTLDALKNLFCSDSKKED
ncbi:hypothetical protein KBA84_05980 [Patescibacteria group bacterium]|nr:hypothetical protein [Patescibacteria group bacterium]